MKTIKRLIYAIKVAAYGYKHQAIFQLEAFKFIGEMFKMLEMAQESKGPTMFHVGYINPLDGKDHRIISVWAAYGDGTPIERIAELKKEIEQLKKQTA